MGSEGATLGEGEGDVDKRPGRSKVLSDLVRVNFLSFSLVAAESSARFVPLLLARRANPL